MSESCVDVLPQPLTYIVRVSETLVAQDLAQTIVDFDPGATVVFATTLQEAVAALDGAAALAVAFISGNPDDVLGCGLSRAITDRGGRVVLLGLEAEARGPSAAFDVLLQPFDTDAVVAKLRAD